VAFPVANGVVLLATREPLALLAAFAIEAVAIRHLVRTFAGDRWRKWLAGGVGATFVASFPWYAVVILIWWLAALEKEGAS
jgi:hypothetical protein